MLKKANYFDFSGLISATDFTFYKIGKYIEQLPNKDKISNEFLLNGCKYISIWSFYYLNKALGKKMFENKENKNVS